MKFQWLILLFLHNAQLYSQVLVRKVDLKQVNCNQILRILHAKSDFSYDESEWMYGDSLPSYKTRDSLTLTNSYKYFYPERRCYQTSWKFIDTKKNEINIDAESFMCKEPPAGGIVTLNKLSLEKIGNDFFLFVLNDELKIVDSFKILKIDYVDTKIKDKAYQITLLRKDI